MKRLAIFARAPVYGRVKTRLAKDIGKQAALAAHRELLARTMDNLGAPNDAFKAELWLDGHCPEMRAWQRRMPVRRQPEGDLGARMLAAFAGGASVVVGSDVPPLGASYVASALDALGNADLVLGPVEDGGYCLIGMNEPRPELFADIPWSTDAVLAETIKAARRLSVVLLETLWDVDVAADLQRWRAMQQARRAEAVGAVGR